MASITMDAQGAISASLAECYVTVGTNRYNFMQMISFEAKITKNKTTVPILGQTGRGNKANGWSGVFSGKAHYNQSVFRELLIEYKETGEDIYFDIQVTNSDPASAAGEQTMIFTGCNIDGGILAKFDAEGDYLSETITGTFEDFKMPQKFSVLSGME
ncbi:MAG: phage tail tube protein [Clostridia bacterium]|nr:phage tail tube protein [Clostridia bacterium]